MTYILSDIEKGSHMTYDKKNLVYRAGLIPYRITIDNNIEMLFMFPAHEEWGGGHVAQMAKGRIEPGETAKEAAIREAREEVGLFPSCIDGDVIELGVFLGRTTVFICKMKPDAVFGFPGEETGEVAWMTPEEFELVGRELHRTVVNVAVSTIRLLEGII